MSCQCVTSGRCQRRSVTGSCRTSLMRDWISLAVCKVLVTVSSVRSKFTLAQMWTWVCVASHWRAPSAARQAATSPGDRGSLGSWRSRSALIARSLQAVGIEVLGELNPSLVVLLHDFQINASMAETLLLHRSPFICSIDLFSNFQPCRIGQIARSVEVIHMSSNIANHHVLVGFVPRVWILLGPDPKTAIANDATTTKLGERPVHIFPQSTRCCCIPVDILHQSQQLIVRCTKRLLQFRNATCVELLLLHLLRSCLQKRCWHVKALQGPSFLSCQKKWEVAHQLRLHRCWWAKSWAHQVWVFKSQHHGFLPLLCSRQKGEQHCRASKLSPPKLLHDSQLESVSKSTPTWHVVLVDQIVQHVLPLPVKDTCELQQSWWRKKLQRLLHDRTTFDPHLKACGRPPQRSWSSSPKRPKDPSRTSCVAGWRNQSQLQVKDISFIGLKNGLVEVQIESISWVLILVSLELLEIGFNRGCVIQLRLGILCIFCVIHCCSKRCSWRRWKSSQRCFRWITIKDRFFSRNWRNVLLVVGWIALGLVVVDLVIANLLLWICRKWSKRHRCSIGI